MKIGTRGSALALSQVRTVADLIRESGGPQCEIVVIKTSGDESTVAAPPSTPSTPGTLGTQNVKRLFVKEIEEALLSGRIDAAVHSAKDLPTELPAGLRIGAALPREDPRDVLVLPVGTAVHRLEVLKEEIAGKPIGTSSVRRAALLHHLFPHSRFVPVRGNVDTRLRKLDARENYVALVLAAAGLKRLGLADRISVFLPVDVCIPAPGQGIVAIEIAENGDPAVGAAIAAISDPDAEAMLQAERAGVEMLGGGCQLPLGILAALDEHLLTVAGVVASRDGRTRIRATVTGQRGGPRAAGEKLAARLLAKGAADLLK